MNPKKKEPGPKYLTLETALNMQKKIQSDSNTKARDYFIPLIEQRVKQMIMIFRKTEALFSVPLHVVGVSPYNAKKVARKLRKHFRKQGFHVNGSSYSVHIKWPLVD